MSNTNYYGIQKSDYQTSLSHYKYIKRVKKNGKWRYYYDKNSLNRDFNSKIGMDKEVDRTVSKIKAEVSEERAEKLKKEYENANSVDKEKAYEKYRQAEINKIRSKIDALKKQMAYDKTPMGAIEIMGKEIDSGINWVKKKMNIH